MGKLIVIDGLDGCGKGTQVDILCNKLCSLGYNAHKLSFPNYESLSSGPVRMLLNREIVDDPSILSPYLLSSFFAVDRGIQYFKNFIHLYKSDTILLSDRYISANIIYQGVRFRSNQEKINFFKWVYDLEVNKLGIPLEDITIALTLPPSVSRTLLNNRYSNSNGELDLYEQDLTFLENARLNLDFACKVLPSLGYNWVRYACSYENGTATNITIKPIDEISSDLLNMILKIIS